MTKRNIVLLILGLLAGLALVVVLFVAAITGFVFYTIGNSEAAEAARTFLRDNERLKSDIGEVRDFGSFVTGNINTGGGDGVAAVKLKVIGARRTVNATVNLAFTNSQQWRVTGGTYVNETGKTVELFGSYEGEPGDLGGGEEENPGDLSFVLETSDDTFEEDVLTSDKIMLVLFVPTSTDEAGRFGLPLRTVAERYNDRVEV
ncbi:MAG: cytochrome c oxidase assembly factor Coa1 family protein, partial [Pyrinomonadaceae bacterium]